MVGLLPSFSTYDKGLWDIRGCAAALVNEANFFQFFNPILGIVTTGLGAAAAAYAAVDPLKLDIDQIDKLVSDAANCEGIWEDFTEQLDGVMSDLDKAWQGEAAEAALESFRKSVQGARGQQHNYHVARRAIHSAKLSSEQLIAGTVEAAQEIVNRELPIGITQMIDVATNVIDVSEQLDGVVPVASFISENGAELAKKIDVARYVLSIPMMVQMISDFVELMKDTRTKLDAIWSHAAADMLGSGKSVDADESTPKCPAPHTDQHSDNNSDSAGNKPSQPPDLNGGMEQRDSHSPSSSSVSVNVSTSADASVSAVDTAPNRNSLGSSANTSINEEVVRKIIDDELLKHEKQFSDTQRTSNLDQSSYFDSALGRWGNPPATAGFNPLSTGYPQQSMPAYYVPPEPYPSTAGVTGMTATVGLEGGYSQTEKYVDTTEIGDSDPTSNSQSSTATSTSNVQSQHRPSWGLKVDGELSIDGKGLKISGDLEVGTHATETSDSMDCDHDQNTQGQSEKNTETIRSEEKSTQDTNSEEQTNTTDKDTEQDTEKTVTKGKDTEQHTNLQSESVANEPVSSSENSSDSMSHSDVKKESSTTQQRLPSDSLSSSSLANSGGW